MKHSNGRRSPFYLNCSHIILDGSLVLNHVSKATSEVVIYVQCNVIIEHVEDDIQYVMFMKISIKSMSRLHQGFATFKHFLLQLKADRPHPHDYSTHRQTPWTDNDSSLLFAALYITFKL